MAFSVLYLVLAYHLLRGRLWAWITTIVLLAVTVLLGALTVLGQFAAGDAPLVGLVILVPAVALLLALVAPRVVRQFFTYRRVPGSPAVPVQPGR